jgi:copper(I)-binding protein
MSRVRAFITAALTSASLFSAFPAAAEITIEGLWIRATAGAGKITAGYGTIRNQGPAADELVGVSTPAAATGQIHRASRENGIMRMDEIRSLEIPAGGAAVLAPGAGHHLMLIGVGAPLKAGDEVQVTLTFRDAGPIKTTAIVRPVASQGMEKSH